MALLHFRHVLLLCPWSASLIIFASMDSPGSSSLTAMLLKCHAFIMIMLNRFRWELWSFRELEEILLFGEVWLSGVVLFCVYLSLSACVLILVCLHYLLASHGCSPRFKFWCLYQITNKIMIHGHIYLIDSLYFSIYLFFLLRHIYLHLSLFYFSLFFGV